MRAYGSIPMLRLSPAVVDAGLVIIRLEAEDAGNLNMGSTVAAAGESGLRESLGVGASWLQGSFSSMKRILGSVLLVKSEKILWFLEVSRCPTYFLPQA
jgi:hypothetical protein